MIYDIEGNISKYRKDNPKLFQYIEDIVEKKFELGEWDKGIEGESDNLLLMLLYEIAYSIEVLTKGRISPKQIIDKLSSEIGRLRFGDFKKGLDDKIKCRSISVTSEEFTKKFRRGSEISESISINYIDKEEEKNKFAVAIFENTVNEKDELLSGIDLYDLSAVSQYFFHEIGHVLEKVIVKVSKLDREDLVFKDKNYTYINTDSNDELPMKYYINYIEVLDYVLKTDLNVAFSGISTLEVHSPKNLDFVISYFELSEGVVEYIAREIMKTIGRPIANENIYPLATNIIKNIFEREDASKYITRFLTEPYKIIREFQSINIKDINMLTYLNNYIIKSLDGHLKSEDKSEILDAFKENDRKNLIEKNFKLYEYIEDIVEKKFELGEWDKGIEGDTEDLLSILLYDYSTSIEKLTDGRILAEEVINKLSSELGRLRLGDFKKGIDDLVYYGDISVTSDEYKEKYRKRYGGFGAHAPTYIDEDGKIKTAIALFDKNQTIRKKSFLNLKQKLSGIDLSNLSDVRQTLFHEFTHVMERSLIKTSELDKNDIILKENNSTYINSALSPDLELEEYLEYINNIDERLKEESLIPFQGLTTIEIRKTKDGPKRIIHNQITEGVVEYITRKILQELGEKINDSDRYSLQVRIVEDLFEERNFAEYLTKYFTKPHKIISEFENIKIKDTNLLHDIGNNIIGEQRRSLDIKSLPRELFDKVKGFFNKNNQQLLSEENINNKNNNENIRDNSRDEFVENLQVTVEQNENSKNQEDSSKSSKGDKEKDNNNINNIKKEEIEI